MEQLATVLPPEVLALLGTAANGLFGFAVAAYLLVKTTVAITELRDATRDVKSSVDRLVDKLTESRETDRRHWPRV